MEEEIQENVVESHVDDVVVEQPVQKPKRQYKKRAKKQKKEEQVAKEVIPAAIKVKKQPSKPIVTKQYVANIKVPKISRFKRTSGRGSNDKIVTSFTIRGIR